MGKVNCNETLKITPSDEKMAEISETMINALKKQGFAVKGDEGEFKISGGNGPFGNFEGTVSISAKKKNDGYDIEMDGKSTPGVLFWILLAVGIIAILIPIVGIPILIVDSVMLVMAGKKPAKLFDEAMEKVRKEYR